MGKLLVHITKGPESPTTAALALLVGRSALELGHEVAIFFAGDAVPLLRAETTDVLQGIGTGSFREHLDACTRAGASIYASGMSAKARGLSQEHLPESVTLAPPTKLVDLLFESDRSLVY